MADPIETIDTVFEDRVRIFQDFLTSDADGITNYQDAIKLMLQRGRRRLAISIDELRHFNTVYARELLEKPAEYLEAAEKALKETISAIYQPYEFEKPEKKFKRKPGI